MILTNPLLSADPGLLRELKEGLSALLGKVDPSAVEALSGPARFWTWAALAVSVILVAAAVAFIVYRKLSARRKNRLGSDADWVIFSGLLLISVWLLRLPVGCYAVHTGDTGLTAVEEIFNSMVHALQTFSMDEDYTEYIVNGREMMAALTGGSSVWATVYGIYASLMNISAPVVGGALLFQILASIFPRISFFFLRCNRFAEIHYFSELNEQSVALAQSIIAARPGHFTVPIFTDAYVDDEDEKRSELMAEARQMGGICLRDDLAHVAKWGLGRRFYYLIDVSEVSNLQTLTDLANENNHKWLKDADVYLFCNGDLYTRIEGQVYGALKSYPDWDAGSAPRICPVHSYRNLVSNLLEVVPLFEPIVGETGKDRELNVTILGGGSIGTELFLAVYWMGQMLDVRLNINVVSKEDPEIFEEKIDCINPEIRRTVEWHGSKVPLSPAPENDPILSYGTGRSPVYATVRYLPHDVKKGSFWRMEAEDDQRLLKSHYFIVALGSDEDNVTTAEKIRQRIGEAHIKALQNASPEETECPHTVISYVVYDSDLCDALNRKKKYCSVSGTPDVYMHAFGSRREVFSYANIMMTSHSVLASGVGAGYSAAQAQSKSRELTDKALKKWVKDGENRDYNQWADLARALHTKYKVFSSGLIRTSVFDTCDEEDRLHRKAVADACLRYKSLLVDPKADGEGLAELNALRDRLAWLEHRRWNAFTRIRGFQYTDGYRSYFNATGSYKHMSLKLHPCLLECDGKGKRDLFPTPGTVAFGLAEDPLDRLSCELYARGWNDYDFKTYDYPQHGYGEYVDLEGASVLLRVSDPLAAEKILGKLPADAVFTTHNGRTLYSKAEVEALSEYDLLSSQWGPLLKTVGDRISGKVSREDLPDSAEWQARSRALEEAAALNAVRKKIFREAFEPGNPLAEWAAPTMESPACSRFEGASRYTAKITSAPAGNLPAYGEIPFAIRKGFWDRYEFSDAPAGNPDEIRLAKDMYLIPRAGTRK